MVKQAGKASDYLVQNAKKLASRFSGRYVAVRASEVHGDNRLGIIVDSDISIDRLHERIARDYDTRLLLVGSFDQLIKLDNRQVVVESGFVGEARTA